MDGTNQNLIYQGGFFYEFYNKNDRTVCSDHVSENN